MAWVADTGRRSTRPSSARWWALVIVGLATLMATMDTGIVVVALPSAQRALRMSDSDRAWVITAYTLAYGGLLLVGGRLADRLGHRRALLVGATGFVVSSAAGGAALSGGMLIAARALQGAFAALLVPSARALVAILFPEERPRTRAFGIFAATITTGAILGFIVSGLLADFLSWRWSLYANVPVAAAVWAGTLLFVPDIAGDASVGIDIFSAIMASGGLALVVFGLSEAASAAWVSGPVAIPLALGLFALVGFVVRQAVAASPLLPLSILASGTRAPAFLALALSSVGTFGLALIATYELQVALHYSPLATGAALVPFALTAAMAAALLAPRLMRTVPSTWLFVSGLGLAGIGLLCLSSAAATSALWLIVVGESLLGLGNGLSSTPSQVAVMRGLRSAQAGAASALASTSNQIGASVGSALLNSLAVSATAAYAAARPAQDPLRAVSRGYSWAALVGAGLLVIGALFVGGLARAGGTGDP